jgi:hypothetical protein
MVYERDKGMCHSREEHMRSPLRRLPFLALSLLVVSAVFAPIASAQAPTATTGAVEPFPNSTQSAILHGTINPHGIGTAYRFEWGETTSYGSRMPYWWEEGIVGSGTSDVQVSQQIPGALFEPLKPNTVYHYRAIALNTNSEWGIGKDKTFKLATPTLLSSYSESDETVGSASLYASVNPYGLNTTYQFEWGPTTSYGNKIPASPKSLGSGSEPILASEELNGLEPYADYHFRVVLTNAFGTTTGPDHRVYGEE